jgi:CRP-like cAMP-binding protein/tetratricopeptide (TPR) repeat protein
MATPDNEALIHARLFHSDNPEIGRRIGLLRLRGRNVAAGETIFEPDQEADCIFLLAGPRDTAANAPEPLVQVRLAGEGTTRGPRFARIVRGDVFGEAEFLSAGLDPKPVLRKSAARALTPGRVIGIQWSALAELFDLDPKIRARFLKLASNRLLDAIAAHHSQSREDPDIVLADWLIELAADLGVTSNRVTFPKKLNQTEIADELGVSRETISRRLKEWERSGLVVSAGAGLEIVDYSRLARIASLHSGRTRKALARATEDIVSEIDRGDLINARNIAADMLRYFPSSPELLHSLALIAARSGDRDEAIAVLKGARLTADGDLAALRGRVARALKNPFAMIEKIAAGDDWIDDAFDEDEGSDEASPRQVEALTADLAALEARLLKDQAFEGNEVGNPQGAAESRRAYETIWRWGESWYAGVNAAAMALVEGDAKRARGLAKEVLKRLPERPDSYWAAATRAEALLLAGDLEKGLEALEAAGRTDDVSDSARGTTALQLIRLSSRLGVDAVALRKRLGVKSFALVTGHLFRGAEMSFEQQSSVGRIIREHTVEILRDQNVGNVFGALACGTDIVIAEAALEMEIPFHAVLPFSVARFGELSVDIGDPPGCEGSWRKRYDAVLASAASLTIVDDEPPLDRDLEGHFYYGFRFMAGQALMRANLLQAQCRLIAASDGAGAGSLGGTGQVVEDWVEAGRPVDTIVFPHPRKPPGPARARGGSSFRAVVLLWDIGDTRVDRATVRALLKSKQFAAGKSEFQVIERASRVGGEGTAVVTPTLEAAMRFSEACARADDAGGLRIVCDFGPVLGADLKPDERMIARLKAGSDLPGFPLGRPLATLAFATQVVADFGAKLEVRAVGRTEEIKGDAETKARRKSGLPVYRISFIGA